MINIISTQANKTRVTGPRKVYANLVKGLDKIGYPYVINRDLNATKRLWIHDDVSALRHMGCSKAHKIVGPNLFVMPGDIPKDIRLDGTLYLQPSEWAMRIWQQAGFNTCPLACWPVGIDTEEFRPSQVPMSKRKVLVYHKRRDPQELSLILSTLYGEKIDYSLLLYPGYPEEAYKSLLRETSLLIWHAAAESQGIALQEAMACNVPVLVCDVRSLSQTRGGYPFASSVDSFRVSAAPYFNDTCGIRIYELVRLRSAVEDMLGRLATFQPREFILENLSLERQARAFAELWERWDLAFDSGKDERLLTSRLWAGPPLLPRLIRRGRRELQLAIGQAFRRAG